MIQAHLARIELECICFEMNHYSEGFDDRKKGEDITDTRDISEGKGLKKKATRYEGEGCIL